jgi:hypothetical protein
MKEGTLSVLQEEDDTRKSYLVKYDVETDFNMGKGCDE